MANGNPVRRRRLDFGSLAALPIGIGVIIAAQTIQGGSAWSLLHGAAALIVFGGTLGAVLISHSPTQVLRAGKAALDAFYREDLDASELAVQMVGLAVRGHRMGLLALEPQLAEMEDGLLKTGLAIAIDGASTDRIKHVVNVEKLASELDEDAPARVWEAAAGYAPTLGILGAVLGLIQVMQHLRAPGALGAGIATAFVATVYGVGSANLIFLPIAGRLREHAAAAARRRELVAEGLHAIAERASPRSVAERLRPLAPKATRLEDILARLRTPTPPGMVQ